MSENYHNYQLLLAKAAQLYEKYEVGRREPFNVFSVLFKDEKKNYEEELHTPFLHALLDYKKPEDDARENLKDFLQHVRVKDFELGSVKVEQERYFIDILITNGKQAVIIKNKLGAQDRDKQLWRYYKTLEDHGYSDIHLLYLTLDGRDPSDNSVGGLCRKLIKCISYKDIIPWLERCQKRDENEAALQDVVTQYLQFVRKLTDTDSRGKYMDALKKLCLEDNNLVLVHDLNHVMLEAIWNKIGFELRLEDLGLSEKKVSKYGLTYELSEATQIQIHVMARGHGTRGRIWFGIYCPEKDHKRKYKKIKKSLEGVRGEEPDDKYPWWRYADENLNLNLEKPTRENLELLSNKEKRKKVVRKIVQNLKEVLEVIEDIAMVNAIKEGEKTKFVSEKQIFKILEGIS